MHTEDTATEESARPAAASSGKSILIKKSEFCLYLLEDGNIVQSKSKGIQKAASHCEMMGSGFRLENLFVFLYITVYNADETSLGGSNLAAVSFPRKGVSKLSEFDAIVLLVVATGYLLAITQKKYPPILTNVRLSIKITDKLRKDTAKDVSFCIYYSIR